jgi:putative flippase GtrA
MKYSTLRQLIKFAIVGGLSFVIHYSTVIFLVAVFLIRPLVANIFGFSIAMIFAFFGHRFWTFQQSTGRMHTTLFAFFTVNIVNFLINQSLYYVLLTYFHMKYYVALFVVLGMVAIVSFVVNKYWVFKQ